MTSIGSPSPFFFGGKKAYAVDRSLRFNDGDNTYLNRTPSSASNRRTWTWSGWIKRCTFGAVHDLFSAYDGSAYNIIRIGNNDQLNFQSNTAAIKLTNAKLRDPSAWYHIVVSVDTTNNTAADRVIIYINSTRQTLATDNSVSQNTDYAFNTTNAHTLGVYANGSSYDFDGYMAEVNFIDGSQLAPASFGETDAITGQWNPKKYVGSYGTNGFYLNFSDTSSLGADSSGNSNNFTPNNFSTSAGVGNDSLTDTPTNNFCTLNPLDTTSGTFSNGNLNIGLNAGYAARGTFFQSSGKWYFEAAITGGSYQPTYSIIGIQRFSGSKGSYGGTTQIPDGYGLFGGGDKYTGTTASSFSSSISVNDVIGVAYDLDSGSVFFYKNGSLLGGGAAYSSITAGEYAPYISNQTTSNNDMTGFVNFGQRPFATSDGEPPSGYKALNSANLPDPTILLPNKHFDTKLYQGNGSTGQTITYNFGPDFVWMKNRDAGNNHAVVNTVLGRAKGLYPDSNSGDFNSSAGRDVSAFTSNGFTVGEPEQASSTNNNGSDIVAWAWNAGDTDGKTYIVKVYDFSGNNRYIFDDFQTQAVTLDLAEGGTYIFNMDDASNASHPFSIGTAANGTVYTSGITYFLDGVSKTYSEYTSGFSAASTRRLHITVPASAPVLYYWCSVHSGMGGQINTNSTLGSSNFDGSIQTTVKANTTAGFSIVSYTGNGTEGATIGHGLGVTPNHIIWKNRDATVNWINWQTALNDTCVLLNSSVEAISASGNALFTYGDFNSTQLKLKTGTHTNGNNQSILAYCFSEVDGYSKFGSYKGNGSSDGVFVFTGFRPAWLMVKRYDVLNDWPMVDNKRNTYNAINYAVYADLSQAEDTNTRYDFLSNGFKIRSNFNESNASGGSYIYLCFAESPFKYARAR